MARQKESLWSDRALKILRTLPVSWWMKKEAMAIRGLPDIIGCVNGLFVAMELKNSKSKKDKSREALQEYTCNKIVDSGGIAYFRVTPDNFNDVLEDLKERCYLPHDTDDSQVH